MSLSTQDLNDIKARVLDANQEWDRVSQFFDTKNRYDTKHGSTTIRDWYYICFYTNDFRGDIPLGAWRFVHASELWYLQEVFEFAQRSKPEIKDFMTFDILWKVGGYKPYQRKAK